ncbi:MAG: 50S ribosomal protein L4 [Desulfovibrionaceae bacterium]|nr:50S ribosomal protein L4 [Desulfovibrionaceae bacterium]
MATVTVYDQNKQESGEITLEPEVFEVAVRPEILHLVVRAQLAAKRAGTHNAKTRAYVSGGGSKPWKQKGTGRARSGSNRSPVWRGGAIVFGPSPRDYSFKVNSKVRALALRMALSSRLESKDLLVVKDITLPEVKTKHFAGVVRALELKKALIVLPEMNDDLARSARNIPDIKLLCASQLNVADILKHKTLVLLEKAVEPIVKRFVGGEEKGE